MPSSYNILSHKSCSNHLPLFLDADAWDPKGFCSKHGVSKGASVGSAVAAVEPSVLGGVHACADWLVDVVRNGVEGAYRRANPTLFADKDGGEERKVVGRSESSSANCDRQEGIDARQRTEMRRQQSLSRRNTVADVEAANAESMSPEEDGGDATMSDATSIQSSSLHDVQFCPAAASSSKKWLDSKPEALPDDSAKVFDPEAAGSRAAKKARAPPDQSPARLLGDLGRDEHGLFLVLHADDIKIGAHQPTEAIEALKELFSSPGGGGGRPDATSSAAMDAFPLNAPYLPGSLVAAMGPGPRLAPRLGRDANRFLFRAPQADAIINKIIKHVKKHGNCIVWGTQEIIAECGDVLSQTWLDGDPDSSKMIGAAMLNRAKILTDRGLVSVMISRSFDFLH